MSQLVLDKKDADINSIIKQIHSDKTLINQLLNGILSKNDVIRFNSFEALKKLSAEYPTVLYENWDYFKEMLLGKNNYHKMIAVYILANLTAIDADDKFSEIYNDYFALLGGTRAMISSHVALNSAIIYKNKVKFQEKILDKLLNIEDIHEGKQIEMIKAYVIMALEEVYPDLDEKDRVEEFVKKQLDSPSPKTRKKADEFLNKFGLD